MKKSPMADWVEHDELYDSDFRYARPRTPEELKRDRARLIQMAGRYAPAVYTCDDCGAAPTCKLAFDAYNSDGDCLAEK